MEYNVLDICRYVVNYSNTCDNGISNLKLQKVLYFIQAYFLVVTGKPCFKEDIEAWNFGPVVPVAYREYKHFASTNIPYIQSYIIFGDYIWSAKRVPYADTLISHADKKLINSVVDKFADYSSTDLVALTQRQAPWINTYLQDKTNVISLKAIQEYFS